MLTGLTHLALEVTDLDAAAGFYAERFGLVTEDVTEREAVLPVGDSVLRLRRPRSVPRGGVHTHFAFSGSPGTLAAWRARLADLDPEVIDFGEFRSLYVDDPDGNCVEIAVRDGDRDGEESAESPVPTGIFEVVLEVADLDTAVETYTALGFDPVDRGDRRRRIRLTGPVDLELWEPHLGLADARGGVHVDLGFQTDDPTAAAEAVAQWTTDSESVDGGVRIRDGDGHWLTVRRSD